MGLRVNNNIAAMNAYRNLTTTEGQMTKSLEKLSSGFRINRAADDAAGLAISEQLRSQVNGLKVAQRNAQDGISVIQTTEGALTEVHALLQRVRDLAVQAANTGANDATAREQAAKEVESALAEIDRIAAATKFGGKALLAGDGTTANGPAKFTFQVGSEADAVNQLNVDIKAMNVKGLSLNAGEASKTGSAVTSASIAAGADNVSIALTNPDGSAETLDMAALTGITAGNLTSADTAVAEAERKKVTDQVQAQIDGKFGKDKVKVELSQTGADAFTFKFSTVGASLDTKLDVFDNRAVADAATALGFGASTGASTVTASTAGLKGLITAGDTSAITKIDSAIKTVSAQRGDLGAIQNRLEHTIANLAVTTENLSASESRIRDTDMAQEMTNYTRSQILVQAGTAMLAQANSSTQSVLSLLRG